MLFIEERVNASLFFANPAKDPVREIQFSVGTKIDVCAQGLPNRFLVIHQFKESTRWFVSKRPNAAV